MVFKTIQRIKDALPEVLHIVMYYNNGIVYQTTFKHSINTPKLGESLAELISDIQKIYGICDFSWHGYKKLIFETEGFSIIVLQLGEDSNIALFFKKSDLQNIKLYSIRRYLKRIEELIDMSKVEILYLELEHEQEELKQLNEKLGEEQQQIQLIKDEIKSKSANELEYKGLKLLSKELDERKSEFNKIQNEIKSQELKIEDLLKEIEEEKKK